MTWVGLQSLIVAFTGHAHLIVFYNHLPEEEIGGCFTLIVLLLLCGC